jgi:hypothetical protein
MGMAIDEVKPETDDLECQDCHQRTPDVRATTCPYAQDVNNEIVNITVCDDCLTNRAQGI